MNKNLIAIMLVTSSVLLAGCSEVSIGVPAKSAPKVVEEVRFELKPPIKNLGVNLEGPLMPVKIQLKSKQKVY